MVTCRFFTLDIKKDEHTPMNQALEFYDFRPKNPKLDINPIFKGCRYLS